MRKGSERNTWENWQLPARPHRHRCCCGGRNLLFHKSWDLHRKKNNVSFSLALFLACIDFLSKNMKLDGVRRKLERNIFIANITSFGNLLLVFFTTAEYIMLFFLGGEKSEHSRRRLMTTFHDRSSNRREKSFLYDKHDPRAPDISVCWALTNSHRSE